MVKGGDDVAKAVHQFSGWHVVTGSMLWHFFCEGVSLCGRYTESRIGRRAQKGQDTGTCKNCERSRGRRAIGGKLPS